MNKPNILFVDDEINILNGIRRGLRQKRDEWNMLFTDSGPEALKIAKEISIDIIISDMRMPQMDGAELLENMQNISPNSARIILSGYAEEGAILKVIASAHQYLAKPCDFDVLQNCIEKILVLRTFMDKNNLSTFINNKLIIPSLPDIYMKLLKVLEDPTSHSSLILSIIEKDLGLKSQIMKVCNSAFFGLTSKVYSLEKAVNLIGVDTIRSMALSAGIFSVFDGKEETKKMMSRLSDNSNKIATVAFIIAKNAGFDNDTCNKIYAAGSLSHIGTMIIAFSWPEKFAKAVKMTEETKKPIDICERELIGVDHALIGAYCIGLWGFPFCIYEAIAYHHRPKLSDSMPQKILAVLHFSQQLNKAIVNEEINSELLEKNIDQGFLTQHDLSISAEELNHIISVSSIEGENQ